jgi:hypothetical protein
MDITWLLNPPSALTWSANARVLCSTWLTGQSILGPSLRHLPSSVFTLERDQECLHVHVQTAFAPFWTFHPNARLCLPNVIRV